MLDYRLRPETLNSELYWHDFSIQGYTGDDGAKDTGDGSSSGCFIDTL